MDLGYDPRISMLVKLDADEGTCMVRGSRDDAWHQYKLEDLSTGVCRAKQKEDSTFAQREEVFAEYMAGREIPIEAPAYCCSEQAGKPTAQRVEEFNTANAPFQLMDFGDGHYSLSLNISFLAPSYTNYGQKAFDDFLEELDTDTTVDVRAGVYLYGEGETFQASLEEVAYLTRRLEMNDQFLLNSCDSVEELSFIFGWCPEELFGMKLE